VYFRCPHIHAHPVLCLQAGAESEIPGTANARRESGRLEKPHIYHAIGGLHTATAVLRQELRTRNLAVARIADRTVVSDLQGHPRSMIFVSSEAAYATFC